MSDLSPFERTLLARITADPFASQQHLAEAFGVARSTIAAGIVQLTRKGFVLGRAYVIAEPTRVVCYGGATLDRTYRAAAPLLAGTSNPVKGRRAFGGVARNVAENLGRLGAPTSLVSLVGDDENGRSLIRHLQGLGIDTSHVAVSTVHATAEYVALLDPAESLSLGVADMAIFEAFAVADVERLWAAFAAAAWVFADCNLPAPVLRHLVDRRPGARFKLAVDTVSVAKAARLPADLAGIDLLFADLDEAAAALGTDGRGLSPAALAEALLARGAGGVGIGGPEGLLAGSAGGSVRLAPVPSSMADGTGVGEASTAATLWRLVGGDPLIEAARWGALAGAMTAEVEGGVHPALSTALLDALRHRLPMVLRDSP